MRIDGPIPFAAAQAYGMQPTPKPPAVGGDLIAGSVPGKVTFDGIAAADMQPLQLYACAADRIEAATRLAVGRNLDIQA